MAGCVAGAVIGGGLGARVLRALASQRERVCHSGASNKGLAMWSFMPQARVRSTSAVLALAVMAMMGRASKRGRARRARVALSPSITGICMSISTAA